MNILSWLKLDSSTDNSRMLSANILAGQLLPLVDYPKHKPQHHATRLYFSYQAPKGKAGQWIMVVKAWNRCSKFSTSV